MNKSSKFNIQIYSPMFSVHQIQLASNHKSANKRTLNIQIKNTIKITPCKQKTFNQEKKTELAKIPAATGCQSSEILQSLDL